jgi:hypothetical protein
LTVAKTTALGDSFFVGSADLSGDVGAISSIASPRAIIDVSAINKSGYERLLGRADGSMAFNAFYNPSAGQAHPVLSAVGTVAGTVSAVVSFFHGAAVGEPAASINGKQTDYQVAVAQDMSIALTASTMSGASIPLEWGEMLTTGKQTFSSSGTATKLDNATSTSFGGAGYLHAFSIGSGTATVKIQHSSDDSTYADLITFTNVTAATSERVATAAITTTVNRYVRVNATGTFTNLVAAVNFVRYATSQT